MQMKHRTQELIGMNIKKRTWEIVEYAKPGDRVSKIFDICLMILIVVNVTMVILDSVPSIHAQYGDFLFWFEAFSVAIFTVEYIARVWSCTLLPRYAKPVSGRLRFALHPMLLIDLIAIVPFYLPLLGVDMMVVRIFRLLRILRIFKLMRYSRASALIGNVLKDKIEELALSTILLMFMLIVSAALMYHAEHEVQPEVFSSIPAAIWWSVVTLTTVGYGDVYPVTDLGRVFGGMIAIIGIGIVALPAGILSAGFVEAINKSHEITEDSKCPHCGKKLKL
ncbi:ion transporter [Solemya elarraichensis gill symbiont]|nr:ion transporter [Solemya elarraichensis gill symbiont]